MAREIASSPSGPSLIGPGVVLKGELSAAEDLVIKGTVRGTIRQRCEEHDDFRLSIDQHARVEADIKTGSAIIAGIVVGSIHGRNTVVVKSTARIEGTLTAPQLRLEAGADLEGVILKGKVSRSEPLR